MRWLRWQIDMDFPARAEKQKALAAARIRHIADQIEGMSDEAFAELLRFLPTSTLLGAPFKDAAIPEEGFEAGWKALLSIKERED